MQLRSPFPPFSEETKLWIRLIGLDHLGIEREVKREERLKQAKEYAESKTAPVRVLGINVRN